MKKKCRSVVVPSVKRMGVRWAGEGVARWSILTMLVAAAACASSDQAGTEEPSEQDSEESGASDSQWSFHIYVEKDGVRRRLDLGPVREVSDGVDPSAEAPRPDAGGANFSSISTQSLVGPGVKPQLGMGNGTEFSEFNMEDPRDVSGWMLISGAAQQCGWLPKTREMPMNSQPFTLQNIQLPPWKNMGSFYIFEHAPDSCEQQLAYQEMLLCIASELDSVADAVGDVTWMVQGENPPPIKVIIPPQRSEDRFIARDLAMNVLAHLAWMDTSHLPAQLGRRDTCTEMYGAVYTNTTLLDNGNPATEVNANILFGDGGENGEYLYFLPKKTVNQGNIKALVDGRMSFKTNILRASGRLLHDLIEKSVYADLAAAEQRRAKLTDYRKGGRSAWGTDSPPQLDNNMNSVTYQPRYNSMEHALRVLSGRWEIGPRADIADPWGDRMCGKIRSGELVRRAFGPDLSARVEDRQVTTPGQEKALSLLMNAGIVVPSTTMYATSIETLRESLKEQVRGQRAQRSSIPIGSFDAIGEGKAITALIDELPEADIRFALDRIYSYFRIHVSGDENAAVPAASQPQSAGLKPMQFQSTALGTLGGTAYESLNVTDLAIDVTARMGGVQNASQCTDYYPMPTGASGEPERSLEAKMSYMFSAQDSFAIAQSIQRELTIVREMGFDDSSQSAGFGAAELRAWAGPGQIAAHMNPLTSGNGISLYALGFKPEDWGVADLASMVDDIGLVYGEPWVAECAAGIRSHCPDDFETDYIAHPSSSLSTVRDLTQGAGAHEARIFYGADNTAATFVFPSASWPSKFSPEVIESGASNNHLYVITRRSPKGTGGNGQVLGSLALRESGVSPLCSVSPELCVPVTAAPVSSMQRKLWNDVFGISPRWALGGSIQSGVGKFGSLSFTPKSCIPGVPWDQFVPLENELTSDSDPYENSWKHYLTLAEMAAQRADDLGQQLIDLGLQQDMRREGAAESLAQLCGDFTDLEDATVSGGEVSPPMSDARLQACLSQNLVDVVVLGKAPPNVDLTSPTSSKAFAKEVLGCNAQDPSDPSNSSKCSSDSLSARAINLFDIPKNILELPKECSDAATIIESMSTKIAGDQLNTLAINAKWFDNSDLTTLASGLRMNVDPAGKWSVTFNSLPVMSSDKASRLWPGCLRADAVGSCDGSGASPVLLSRIFRRGAVSNSSTCSDGQKYGSYCVKNLGIEEVEGSEDPADVEDALLLWRVQASLWSIYQMASSAPDNMFNVYLPVADLTDRSRWGGGVWPNLQWPAMPTIYGDGSYADATYMLPPRPLRLNADSNSKQESMRLGDIVDYPSNAILPPNNPEIPHWLSALHEGPAGNGPRYRLVFASSRARGTDTPPDTRAMMASIGKYFHGMSCSSTLGGHTVPRFSGTWDVAGQGYGAIYNLRDGVMSATQLKGWGLHRDFYDVNKMYVPVNDLAYDVLHFIYPYAVTSAVIDENWEPTGEVRSHINDFFVSLNIPLGHTGPQVHATPSQNFGLPQLAPPNAYVDTSRLFESSDIMRLPNNVENSGPHFFQKADPGCSPLIGFSSPIQFINPSTVGGVDCLTDRQGDVDGPSSHWDAPFSMDEETYGFHWAQMTRSVLEPSVFSKEERVPLFVNSYPPPGACGAAAQAMQTFAFTCGLRLGGLVNRPIAPPQISEIKDITALGSWIERQAEFTREMGARLYIENIPVAVVNDLLKNSVTSPDAGGQYRALYMSMRQSIEQIPRAWGRIEKSFATLANSIKQAQNSLQKIDVHNQEKLAHLAIQRANVWLGVVRAAAEVLKESTAYSPEKAAPWTKPAAILATSGVLVAESIAALEVNSQLNELKDLSVEERDLEQIDVLLQLDQTAREQFIELNDAVSDLSIAVTELLNLSGQLADNTNQAKVALAQGAGADYVEVDGKRVSFPVNTVLRRQYDITEQRYKKALTDAKHLAYIASLAIEQRIGKRLTSIKEPVGPLEAPAVWAPKVCSLTGVDYKKLRHASDANSSASGSTGGGGNGGSTGGGGNGGSTGGGGNGGSTGGGGNGGSTGGDGNDDVLVPISRDEYEKAVTAEFADQYVGDYVATLKNFVEYYNIKYPSHDGDDQAVLSLRDDFLGLKAGCMGASPNLLYYSSKLDIFEHSSDVDDPSLGRGWLLNTCSDGDSFCLEVSPGVGVPNPPTPPGGDIQADAAAAGTRMTWLHDFEPPYTPSSGDAPEVLSGIPSRSVAQRVALTAGSYVLSWWDLARAADGDRALLNTTGGAAVAYRVGVYSLDGTKVYGFNGLPHQQEDENDNSWGARHSETFVIPNSGEYLVAFGASSQLGDLGSVIISNVQLEKSSTGVPSLYVDNGASRDVFMTKCPQHTSADLLDAFSYGCEAQGCFYELKAPLVLSTKGLVDGSASLKGKLAAGNFNYRHVSLGVNLAGTGLIDCSEDATNSCYGAGFLEYTLSHDAYKTDIVGWDGEAQSFNFGNASINHGKGLAAERYITLPLSSTDQSLMSQLAIEKQELRGRPLDGSYRFRVWDRPGLVWNRLEDVQFVLKYRYWSAIH